MPSAVEDLPVLLLEFVITVELYTGKSVLGQETLYPGVSHWKRFRFSDFNIVWNIGIIFGKDSDLQHCIYVFLGIVHPGLLTILLLH